MKVGGKSVSEHRWVMEKFLGRPLLRKETVHHKKGPADNSIDDLELKAKAHDKGQTYHELAEILRSGRWSLCQKNWLKLAAATSLRSRFKY